MSTLIGIMTNTGPVIGSQFEGVYMVAGLTHIHVLHKVYYFLLVMTCTQLTLHCGISNMVYTYMSQVLHYIITS